ncbi:MAG: pyridoxamine 5'-phosphate oxidase family protein [Aestuariivita sp.]|nr:pyridoxamine 5'-phosphate oxidase family protein [Aestuariivita sp.]MCY4346303.1 pyridoxamine 5'-phosphate oxidase family protein [Aestuariivita sp.]
MSSVIRSTDNEARKVARKLLQQARFAALSVLNEQKAPFVSRIALYVKTGSAPYSLVSELSNHTQFIKKEAQVSLLIGEPESKGDPLSYPRLTLQADASFVPRDSERFSQMRSDWIEHHPKSQLYADFTDFLFVEFQVKDAYLVAGFGKAYALTAADLKADSCSELPARQVN